MNNKKYNDDFIRTKESKEGENLNNEVSDDSDIEINANNDFFNNLTSNANITKRKTKSLVEMTEHPEALKQSTLEEKIQKISNKKQKRLRKQQNYENLDNEIENPSLKILKPDKKKSDLDPANAKPISKISKDIEIMKPKITSSENKNQTTFQKLNLIKPLLKAIDDLGFVNPTPIQRMAIPPILLGKDVLASSLTGSGKTAAFLLPILQRYYKTSMANYSKVLIVIPARELAVQCYEMLQELNTYTRISSCLIIGAVPAQKQEAELRRYPDIIIATPGRLIDLVKNSQNIDLNDLEILVFDEADKLLELG